MRKYIQQKFSPLLFQMHSIDILKEVNPRAYQIWHCSIKYSIDNTKYSINWYYRGTFWYFLGLWQERDGTGCDYPKRKA